MPDDLDPAPDAGDRRSRLRIVSDAAARRVRAEPDGSVAEGMSDDHAHDAAGRAAEPEAADEPEAQEWAWVIEWRESGEATPWATGLTLAAFAAVLTGVAIWVLSAGLADRPVLAVVLNLLVAGGLAPAMWLSRGLPVLRWFAAGAAVGVVGGWFAALVMLPAG